jgi:hypothetical protein
VSERTARLPVRARSGRRPLPPIIFILVLAVVAGGVWWTQLRSGGSAGTACNATAKAPPSLDPASVTVRVLNATSQQGLAQTVGKDLQARGFAVQEVGNDDGGRKVTGPAEVRHGQPGRNPAAYLAAYVSGATNFEDTRATAVVDLVVGPEFKQLATPEQVAAQLRGDSRAPSSC